MADAQGSYERMKAKVGDELKTHFRPEFLNRIDDIVVFHQLTENEIVKIVDLMVAQLDERLKAKDMGIELTTGAKSLLAKRGYDPVLGARPLRRTIQRELEDVLSEKMLLSQPILLHATKFLAYIMILLVILKSIMRKPKRNFLTPGKT